MSHVFISYSRKDSPFAFLVEHELRQAGFDVWIDKAISGGEQWRRIVDKALDDAYAVVLILSPDANNSLYVSYEWSYALGQWAISFEQSDIKLIPIVHREVDERDLHPRLAELQRIDFTAPPYQWPRLIDTIGRASETARITASRSVLPVPVRNALKAMIDLNPDVRETGLRALLDMENHPAALEALRQTVENTTFPGIRRRAAVQLALMADDPGIDLLDALLDALESDATKADAARALAKLGDRRALPVLIRKMHQRNDFVIEAVGAIGGGEVIDLLLAALSYGDSYADEVALGLGATGDEAALPHLLKMAGPNTYNGGQAAFLALRAFDTPEARAKIDAIVQMKPDWEKYLY